MRKPPFARRFVLITPMGADPVTEQAHLYRLTAFSNDPDGGNPAGVWVGDSLPAPGKMLEIAREVGFSETAFIAGPPGPDRQVRYYSPEAEVSFCGHATIAAGVLLGRLEGEGSYRFHATVGEVPVDVSEIDGAWRAALTSVDTRNHTPADSLLDGALLALDWSRDELDPALPPAVAWAGAWHLVLATGAERLANLDYDFDRLKSLMLEHELTTLQLVHRESDTVFNARDPFPVGGVVEDPATGAAAAALGGYLRDARLVDAPFDFVIRQGVAMGRPSRLDVHVPAMGGVTVSGTAVDLPPG